MRYEDIHIGDTVRFRQWKDMEMEYGTDERGDIQCSCMFIKDMKPLCGTEHTVTAVSERYGCVEFTDDIGGFSISADMLEPVYNKTLVSESEIIQII